MNCILELLFKESYWFSKILSIKHKFCFHETLCLWDLELGKCSLIFLLLLKLFRIQKKCTNNALWSNGDRKRGLQYALDNRYSVSIIQVSVYSLLFSTLVLFICAVWESEPKTFSNLSVLSRKLSLIIGTGRNLPSSVASQ